MSSASFRKIGFFGPGRRLAAPEGPKIAGGASLARREKLKFPAIRQGEGFEIKSRLRTWAISGCTGNGRNSGVGLG